MTTHLWHNDTMTTWQFHHNCLSSYIMIFTRWRALWQEREVKIFKRFAQSFRHRCFKWYWHCCVWWWRWRWWWRQWRWWWRWWWRWRWWWWWRWWCELNRRQNELDVRLSFQLVTPSSLPPRDSSLCQGSMPSSLPSPSSYLLFPSSWNCTNITIMILGFAGLSAE